MTEQRKLPEWVPPEGGEGYASHVMEGVAGCHDGMPGSLPCVGKAPPAKRRRLSVEELADGIRCGNRTMLARAITLVESNSPSHQEESQQLLESLMERTGKSLRIGITGVPGAGKSTMIDVLGSMLCDQGHKVAVLAVDPSSTVTRGSILGDKTRMEKLVQLPNAFIRPSPTTGCLGGVARRSRETVLLCEAFGFDVILLETVGVGQSEVTVRSMVDFFLLVLISGAGDELQGIKKGVIELADAIVVNKADGENAQRARLAKAEYNRVLGFLNPFTEGWKTKALTASAVTGEGIQELWGLIRDFQQQTTASGVFQCRRREQNLDWMRGLVDEALRRQFFSDDEVKKKLEQATALVARGEIPPVRAVEALMSDWIR